MAATHNGPLLGTDVELGELSLLCPQGSNEGPHAGAPNHVNGNARLLHRLDHANMGQPSARGGKNQG